MSTNPKLEVLQQLAGIALTAATIYVTLKPQEGLPDNLSASRARAYHGASVMYGKLATFFGQRAIDAELSYYREIQA